MYVRLVCKNIEWIGDIMYNLGDQFNNSKISSLISLDEATFHGKNYRITILT